MAQNEYYARYNKPLDLAKFMSSGVVKLLFSQNMHKYRIFYKSVDKCMLFMIDINCSVSEKFAILLEILLSFVE